MMAAAQMLEGGGGRLVCVVLWVWRRDGEWGEGSQMRWWRRDVQCANKEDGCQGEFLPQRQGETPDRRQWHDEDCKVEEDICDGCSEKRCVVVHAFAVWIWPDPRCLDRHALKHVGEDDGGAPYCYQGEYDHDGYSECFAYTEETVVEEEDGYFDDGYGEDVEDLVDYCGLSFMMVISKGTVARIGERSP